MKNTYTSVCDKCLQKGWHKVETPCVREVKAYAKCGHWEGGYKKCTGTNRLIDYSKLDKRFEYAHDNNYRIEITYEWGEKERGYIGLSTGWKPCWLLIKRSNSFGGGALLQEAVTDIKLLYVRH